MSSATTTTTSWPTSDASDSTTTGPTSSIEPSTTRTSSLQTQSASTRTQLPTASNSSGSGSTLPPFSGNICSNPPVLRGGSVLSSGPYYGNISYASFSCFTGFMLQGTGQLLCRLDGTWSDTFPKCVPVSNNPYVDTKINFGDYGNIPVWLAVTMGVTFGIIALLLLTCLCMYCLKICGCWRGAVHGHGGMATWDRAHYLCCCCYPVRRTAPSRTISVSTVEGQVSENMDNRESKYVEEPIRTRYQPGRPSQTSIFSFDPDVSLQNWKLARQKRAKVPDSKVWMPHSKQIRNINTSTQ